MRWPRLRCFIALACANPLSHMASAGPPYTSDDPVPTDEGHFEIYAFNEGRRAGNSTDGSLGVDFNYGAGPDLQLTAVLPIGFAFPDRHVGFGNAALGMKYRFLNNSDAGGWQAALFPQVSFAAGSRLVGETHASVFIPVWFERDWNRWSAFGGGGCTIQSGGSSRNFCEASWALAKQVSSTLQIGGELAIASSEGDDTPASERVGVGIRYDVSQSVHLLGYAATAIASDRGSNDYSWYVATLSTF